MKQSSAIIIVCLAIVSSFIPTVNTQLPACGQQPAGQPCTSAGNLSVGQESDIIAKCSAFVAECIKRNGNEGDCKSKETACKDKVQNQKDMNPNGPKNTFGFDLGGGAPPAAGGGSPSPAAGGAAPSGAPPSGGPSGASPNLGGAGGGNNGGTPPGKVKKCIRFKDGSTPPNLPPGGTPAPPSGAPSGAAGGSPPSGAPSGAAGGAPPSGAPAGAGGAPGSLPACGKQKDGEPCTSAGNLSVGKPDDILAKCSAIAQACIQKSGNEGDCKSKEKDCKEKVNLKKDMNPNGPKNTFGFDA